MLPKVGLDIQTACAVPSNAHGRYVRCTNPFDIFEPVMVRKAVAQASGQVVRLADVDRHPSRWRPVAEDVDAGDRGQRGSDGRIVKFIPRAACPDPNNRA